MMKMKIGLTRMTAMTDEELLRKVSNVLQGDGPIENDERAIMDLIAAVRRETVEACIDAVIDHSCNDPPEYCSGTGHFVDAIRSAFPADAKPEGKDNCSESPNSSDARQRFDADWLVWSNYHSAWWGPSNRGYYADIESAGRYTLEDAIKASNTRSRRVGEPPQELVVPSPELIQRILAARELGIEVPG